MVQWKNLRNDGKWLFRNCSGFYGITETGWIFCLDEFSFQPYWVIYTVLFIPKHEWQHFCISISWILFIINFPKKTLIFSPINPTCWFYVFQAFQDMRWKLKNLWAEILHQSTWSQGKCPKNISSHFVIIRKKIDFRSKIFQLHFHTHSKIDFENLGTVKVKH